MGSENLLTVSFVVIFDDSSYALQITHYKPIIPSKFHCSTYLASLTPIFPPKNKPINSNYLKLASLPKRTNADTHVLTYMYTSVHFQRKSKSIREIALIYTDPVAGGI